MAKDDGVESKIKLDLGSGRAKREGCLGVDIVDFPGITDIVLDLRQFPYPWKDNSVDYIYSHHTLEHFDWPTVIKIMNECWRILEPEHFFELVVPLYPSDGAIEDPSHLTFFGIETFGRFEPESQFAYETGIHNMWRRKKNDWTPEIIVENRSDGTALLWPRLRELHIILKKIDPEKGEIPE